MIGKILPTPIPVLLKIKDESLKKIKIQITDEELRNQHTDGSRFVKFVFYRKFGKIE
jgi:hypothetical protein